jgi:cell division protein ZapA
MQEPITLEILGQTLTVTSSDSERHVRAVARYVEERMQQLTVGRAVPPLPHLALLAALNIASEYQKLQRDQEELERVINRMMQRVSACVPADTHPSGKESKPRNR